MKKSPLLIIGAGPAGISAAIESAKFGVDVTMIDENSKPGGQIYRQFPDAFTVRNHRKLGKEFFRGEELINELNQHNNRIEYINNASVWGIFEENEVAFEREGDIDSIKPQKLVITEGAYDRPIPFPGWTLPGILATGGALKMVKIDRVIPGERILLAGTGPLQLVLADHLIKSGVQVLAILEAASSIELLKCVPELLSQWRLFRDGLGYFMSIRKAKIPILTSHVITEARGDEKVEEVTYAKVDNSWKPIAGSEKRIATDTVCLGYGLIPSTRLSRLCRCEHKYDQYLGGWVPHHNEKMETSVKGVFVAGDSAGIGGAVVAQEEGRIAAIEACCQLGFITVEEARSRSSPIQKRLQKLANFESALNRISVIRKGLLSRITDETVICRCKEIAAGEIRKRIMGGAKSLGEIKRFTTAGMGHCQGRMCEYTITQILASSTKQPIYEVGYLTPRPPVKPLAIKSFPSVEEESKVKGFVH